MTGPQDDSASPGDPADEQVPGDEGSPDHTDALDGAAAAGSAGAVSSGHGGAKETPGPDLRTRVTALRRHRLLVDQEDGRARSGQRLS